MLFASLGMQRLARVILSHCGLFPSQYRHQKGKGHGYGSNVFTLCLGPIHLSSADRKQTTATQEGAWECVYIRMVIHMELCSLLATAAW